MFLTSITEFGFHLLMCQIIEDILVQHTWNENEIYILRSRKQKYHWSKESQWPDGSLKKRFGNAQETRTTFGKLALIYHSKQT